MIHRKIPFFLHPWPLLAVMILALNDHILKTRFPGFITGKLSDFVGLFYFPIFLAAIIVLLTGQRFSRRLTLGMIVCADVLLISVKLSPVLAAFVDSIFGRYLFTTHLVADPTDLAALIMNYPTYRHCARFFIAPVLPESVPRK